MEKRRAQKSRKLISRPIRHPYFKNLSALQTADALRDSDVGACLFTPSSRGTDQITLTIKVCLSAELANTCHEYKPETSPTGLTRLTRV